MENLIFQLIKLNLYNNNNMILNINKIIMILFLDLVKNKFILELIL